jgi:hypothetical protein
MVEPPEMTLADEEQAPEHLRLMAVLALMVCTALLGLAVARRLAARGLNQCGSHPQ